MVFIPQKLIIRGKLAFGPLDRQISCPNKAGGKLLVPRRRRWFRFHQMKMNREAPGGALYLPNLLQSFLFSHLRLLCLWVNLIRIRYHALVAKTARVPTRCCGQHSLHEKLSHDKLKEEERHGLSGWTMGHLHRSPKNRRTVRHLTEATTHRSPPTRNADLNRFAMRFSVHDKNDLPLYNKSLGSQKAKGLPKVSNANKVLLGFILLCVRSK